MALNFTPTSLPSARDKLQLKNNGVIVTSKPSSKEKNQFYCKVSQTESVQEDSVLSGSSARAQLNLLEQLRNTSSAESSYEGDFSICKPTIREQLSEIIGDREGDFTIRLGKRLKESIKSLTISQRRNIKRQAYLNEVSRRNDSVFFATIGAFVILPPIAILGVAVLTGYVQLFP